MDFMTALYRKQERANALTHGMGILLALAGSVFLILTATKKGLSDRQLFGIWLFGISMIILYAFSTLYHSVHEPSRKSFCRKLDHIAIYFLIAGTHTPFIFYYLDNPKGWVYLSVLWGLGLLGTLGKLFFFGKWDRLSLVLYLFMGWMIVFVLPDILPSMSREVLVWIGIGGFFYTAGVFFYVKDHLSYHHAIWHLFVIAGTAGHYVALWKALGET